MTRVSQTVAWLVLAMIVTCKCNKHTNRQYWKQYHFRYAIASCADNS